MQPRDKAVRSNLRVIQWKRYRGPRRTFTWIFMTFFVTTYLRLPTYPATYLFRYLIQTDISQVPLPIFGTLSCIYLATQKQLLRPCNDAIQLGQNYPCLGVGSVYPSGAVKKISGAAEMRIQGAGNLVRPNRPVSQRFPKELRLWRTCGRLLHQ